MSLSSPGFVIHRYNYRETSRILRCLTHEFGRVDLICKGCRGSGKSAKVVEPFRYYEFSWSGKAELKTLRQADELRSFQLSKEPERLYCGFYLNELLHGLMKTHEAEPEIFQLYRSTLASIETIDIKHVHMVLRQFELGLLESLGYGLNLQTEEDGHTPIDENGLYRFDIEQGFCRVLNKEQSIISGESILALSRGDLSIPQYADEARKLMRFVLQFHLPSDSIQSRKFFF